MRRFATTALISMLNEVGIPFEHTVVHSKGIHIFATQSYLVYGTSNYTEALDRIYSNQEIALDVESVYHFRPMFFFTVYSARAADMLDSLCDEKIQ